jgi:hypothetical protein
MREVHSERTIIRHVEDHKRTCPYKHVSVSCYELSSIQENSLQEEYMMRVYCPDCLFETLVKRYEPIV